MHPLIVDPKKFLGLISKYDSFPVDPEIRLPG